MKVCTKCKCSKEKSEFRSRVKAKDGLQYWCKSCENIANIGRYIKKPKIIKSKEDIEITKHNSFCRMLKHRYKLKYEDYLSMYEKQNRCCAICKESYILGSKSGLYVDHCHKTGEVRGLLCTSCNSAIGKLKENRDIFISAMKYLNIL